MQNKQVARDFAIYYELYQKYRQAYNIDAILQGVWDEDVLTQARSAKMDERMSLVSLLLEAVFLQMEPPSPGWRTTGAPKPTKPPLPGRRSISICCR